MSVITLIFLLLVVGAGLAYWRTHSKAKGLSLLTWDQLVSELKPLPMEAIGRIAEGYLDPLKPSGPARGEDLWDAIGGVEGLERMYANARVLLALASYTQNWDEEESHTVVGQMRRDSLVLRRAVLDASIQAYRVRGDEFSVQQAVSSYWLMRSRVLALYERNHVARLSKLAELLDAKPLMSLCSDGSR